MDNSTMPTRNVVARRVHCIGCKRLTASARYNSHSTNIYSFSDRGTWHAKCLADVVDNAFNRHNKMRKVSDE